MITKRIRAAAVLCVAPMLVSAEAAQIESPMICSVAAALSALTISAAAHRFRSR